MRSSILVLLVATIGLLPEPKLPGSSDGPDRPRLCSGIESYLSYNLPELLKSAKREKSKTFTWLSCCQGNFGWLIHRVGLPMNLAGRNAVISPERPFWAR